MSSAAAVVSGYHEAWTTGRYDDAAGRLAPAVEVEAPMGDGGPYVPGSVDGLRWFAGRIESVHTLSQLSGSDEAVVLYDALLHGGTVVRVAEHFTVEGGRIVRLRRIHDPGAFRGPSRGASAVPDGPGYRRELPVDAPAAQVFAALTDVEAIRGWWTSRTHGRTVAGGRLELGFVGLDERIVLEVAAVVPPTTVVWECLDHSGHPEWVGTSIVLSVRDGADDGSVLGVHHVGLVPTLTCFTQCEAGWNHFLASIRAYVEQGVGMPYDARVAD